MLTLAACTGEAPVPRAGGDGAADRGRDGGGAEVADVGADAAVACTSNAGCPARHFCGAASRTCISAVVEVVGGVHHSCARHESGAVSCWGLAESIRAGGGALLPPVRVQEAAGVRGLSAGLHQTCGVTADATVRCWGNLAFEVARADMPSAPVTAVTAVSLGGDYGCAAAASGVWCWGKNTFGQLAQPLTLDESAGARLALPGAQRLVATGATALAYDAAAARLCAWGRNLSKVISSVDGVDVFTTPECRTQSDVADLVAGDAHACVRHGDGRFTCWGERYYGQLGADDTAISEAVAVIDVPPPGLLGSSAPARALVAGVSHTCALLGDGTVSCFGRNDHGQIGPGPTGVEEEIRKPTAVTGLAGVVAVGSGSSAQHTCAIVGDGSVVCWGDNHAGQLGDAPGGLDPTRLSRQPVVVRF